MIDLAVVWGGVLSGSVYALIGLAYLVVLRATNTLNFAVGGLVGFGAVAAASWQSGRSGWLVVTMVLATTAVISLAIDVVVTRPIQNRDDGHFGVVLALTAAFFVVIQITGEVFTASAVLGRPMMLGTVEVGSMTLTKNSLIVVGTAVLLSATLWAWMKHGRYGRLLAAIGDESQTAVLLTLPIRGIRLLAVTLGGALAGLTGFLIASFAPVTFQSGFPYALVGLIALMLGGPSSAWGPVVGGFAIGLTEALAAQHIGSAVREYVLVVLVFLLFTLRPQGIFAAQVRY